MASAVSNVDNINYSSRKLTRTKNIKRKFFKETFLLAKIDIVKSGRAVGGRRRNMMEQLVEADAVCIA